MELVSTGIRTGGRSLGLKGFVTSKLVGGLLMYLEVDKSNLSSVILPYFRLFLSVKSVSSILIIKAIIRLYLEGNCQVTWYKYYYETCLAPQCLG